jgi:hypothetical protein
VKIPLVGPSYEQRSIPFDAQRSINLFPVLDQMGKEVSALYGTPGLSLFATCGNGPIRGIFTSTTGRDFVVSGPTLYELSTDGVATSRGTLESSIGIVSIDENGQQLAICDGSKLYIFTYATNVFAKVTDSDFPTSVGTVTFIDGYFVVNQNSTGKFYISALYNGLAWAALDFATAESSPDELRRVLNAVGQLWLFGTKTTEIYTNTGASTFPFERISSAAKIGVGILAPHTAVEVDNSVFWVGKDNIGSGVVYRAAGFSAKRISNTPIELKIQEVTDIENMRAYTYQEDGNVFYVLTGGGLETALVYDIASDLWHERAYLEDDGSYGQPLQCCLTFSSGGFHLGGSRVDGKVYKQSLDYYSDDGAEIARDRIYTHVSDEDKRQRYSTLTLSMETGVGLQTGQGSNPIVSMRVSKDMGRTWSNWYDASIGAVGNYRTKVNWNRIGIAECLTFNIRITDPVKVSLIGSYLE